MHTDGQGKATALEEWMRSEGVSIAEAVPHLAAQEQRVRAYLDERCRSDGWCWNYERIVEGLGWRYDDFEERRRRGEYLRSRPYAGIAEFAHWLNAPTGLSLPQLLALRRQNRDQR